MAQYKDIKLNSNESFFYTGDLAIVDGDLAIAPSDPQHIQDIILADPNFWKQFPSLGVGLRRYLNSSGQQQQLSRAIKLQLQSDGYTVSPNPKVEIGSKTSINPNAVRI